MYDGVGHCTRQTLTCVIDTVAPQVSVSYDNNEAQNECYFNSARTATIVVTDEHFDADGVSILKTMESEQENVAVTEVESVSWTTQGNQHTATVSFIEDGTYTLAIGVTDLAGNESNTIDYGNCVAGERFVIDTGIDAFTVEGVEDAAAYSGALSLQLVISDANLDAYDVSLKRTRMYDVDADVTEQLLEVTERSETLVAWSADAFAETEETDGIYTLSLWATDLAGNEQEQQLTFSVNRFGSVYVFDAYLLSLLQQDGGYLQSVEEDLVITEYNASPLDGTSLLLYITKDGHPLKDVAYSVSREKTDAADVGASGWYTYVYTFYKENFCEDGLYKISISSVDSAGNQSENTNQTGREISFWVDQTSPELTAVDDLKRSIFQGMTAEISYTVFDAVGLQSVAVYVDDALYEEAVTDFDADQNNYTGSFSLTAKKAGQQVRIVVTDLAGNTSDVSCGAFSGGHLFLRNASDTGLAYLQRVSETLQEEKWMVVPMVVTGCAIVLGLLLWMKRKRLLAKRQSIFGEKIDGFDKTVAVKG